MEIVARIGLIANKAQVLEVFLWNKASIYNFTEISLFSLSFFTLLFQSPVWLIQWSTIRQGHCKRKWNLGKRHRISIITSFHPLSQFYTFIFTFTQFVFTHCKATASLNCMTFLCKTFCVIANFKKYLIQLKVLQLYFASHSFLSDFLFIFWIYLEVIR